MKQIKKVSTKLSLATFTIRPLVEGEMRSAAAASGTLCQSGTPTVSSYQSTCR
jgi:hypothetical protein